MSQATVIGLPLSDAVIAKLTPDETEHLNNHATSALHAELERKAISLADTTIRRLFTISLHAEGALKLSTNPAVIQRLENLVAEVDTAIKELGVTALQMHRPGDPAQP